MLYNTIFFFISAIPYFIHIDWAARESLLACHPCNNLVADIVCARPDDLQYSTALFHEISDGRHLYKVEIERETKKKILKGVFVRYSITTIQTCVYTLLQYTLYFILLSSTNRIQPVIL